MAQRAAFLWALGGAFLCLNPASAQVARRLQGCSPYSQTSNGSYGVGTRPETPRPPRIVVDEVKFEGSTLPTEIHVQLTQLMKEIRQRAWAGWIDEVGEIVVRGALLDQGYFRIEEKAEADVLSSDAEFQHVAITLHIDLGLQYGLGEVSFRSANATEVLAFPREELRKAIPLSDGELFSTQKIREGLDNLRKLYGSKGYIDFVATPIVEADDATQRISLIMELDQQKQFRIGKVKVISLEPNLKPLLESQFKSGEIFNSNVLDSFFELNKSVLPPNASPEDMEVEHRDVRAGVVDLRFNLLTCSQFRSTLDP